MEILVLAGDKTNYYLYKLLKENSFNVTLEGFNFLLDIPQKKGIVFKGYDIIIAPIPFTIDGLTLYSPYSEDSIHIDDFLNKSDSNSKIIGGPFLFNGNEFKDLRFIDITKDKNFTGKTVIPTCEEIIKIVINNSDVTIYNSKFFINGAGRIGKHLKKLITLLGGDSEITKVEDADVVINTTRDASNLNSLILNSNKSPLIIDATSVESGIDSKRLKKSGFNFIKASGLPGKSSPKSVANYIYTSLINNSILK